MDYVYIFIYIYIYYIMLCKNHLRVVHIIRKQIINILHLLLNLIEILKKDLVIKKHAVFFKHRTDFCNV